MGKKIHDEQSVTGFYFASASGVVSRAIITDSVFIKIFDILLTPDFWH